MKAPFKAALLSHLNLFWVRDPFENLMKTVGSSPGKMHILHPHTHTILQNYRTFTATPRHICASQAEDYTALVGREGQGPWGSLTCIANAGIVWQTHHGKGQGRKNIPTVWV